MEDELRLSLLVAGTFFILAVLAHGIWKIRKGSKSNDSHRSRVEPGEWTADGDELDADDIAWNDDDVGHKRKTDDQAPDALSDPDYDDLGLGKVRIIAGAQDEVTPQPPVGAEGAPVTSHGSDGEPEEPVATHPHEDGVDNDEQTAPDDSDTPSRSQHIVRPEATEKLYGSVVTNPKPHIKSNRPAGEDDVDIPEPPGFLLREKEDAAEEDRDSADNVADGTPDEVDEFSLDPQPSQSSEPPEGSNVSSFSEQARRLVGRKKSRPQNKKRQEPSFGDDQMRIDFEDSAKHSDHEPAAAQAPESKAQNDKPQAAPSGEQEVLVLNVRAPEDEPISGAALLPMLLTLGFKFGEQDIFHRHVNSNGKGPVLFSLANMFKPGVFDIDNLETFTTQGVSLFMILPIEGDPHQVFNMMHNAARKIADEFHAQVLDGRRSVLTKQGLQQYIEKIREFERQRMISRH
ncbi:cell division protein ZipA [Alteromonas antoniana]|uniref:cell division protein ZipA n=1 Tax=Alteromonas antoniana TaxID=2803813 RepID=UPI001C48D52C|nr:cell division protein ZipA [Alteromonas antoniana]